MGLGIDGPARYARAMLRDRLRGQAQAGWPQPGSLVRRLAGRIGAVLGFIAVLPWVIYWILKALFARNDDEEE